MSTIASRITSERERRGWTKAELARRAGISSPYLVQIEGGAREPSEAVVRQLAGALGVENYEMLAAAGYLSAADKNTIGNLRWGIEELRTAVQGNSHAEDMLYGILDSLPQIAAWFGSGAVVQSSGPKSWDELDAKDQRMVQQFINRLRRESAEA